MRTTLLALVLLPLIGTAQSWCPPGATWTYEAGLGLAGFQRMSYRADTVVDGQQAQVIDRYAAIQYPQPVQPTFGGPQVITYTPVAAITRFADEVVHLWSGSEWDTLYWFGAAVGQGWTMAHADESECAPNVVTAAGTDLIDGVPLRWLDFVNASRVYERIGSLWDFFMYCPNIIFDGPMGMRCYRDDELAMLSTWVECEALVGAEEAPTAPEPLLFPNPGGDELTINLPAGAWRVQLLDAQGRELLARGSSTGLVKLDAATLAPGTYHVRIAGATGASMARLWIKE